MMRIFLDTEFTALTEDAKLISIGCVDEAGERSFYAELSDTWRQHDLGAFAAQNVVQLLQGGTCRMPMAEVRVQLARWLTGFDKPVRLATDSLMWDWRWITAMFPSDADWPANLHTTPLLLTMNYLHDFDAFELAVERAFAQGLRRHHALDDAKANRIGWLAAGGDVDHDAGT